MISSNPRSIKLLLALKCFILLVIFGALNAVAFEAKSSSESVLIQEGEKKASIPIPDDYQLCDVELPLCITACATQSFTAWGVGSSSAVLFQKDVQRETLSTNMITSSPGSHLYCASLCGCALWEELKASACGRAEDKTVFIELQDAVAGAPPNTPPALFVAFEQTRQDAKKTDAIGLVSVFSVPATSKCVLDDAVKDKFQRYTAKAVSNGPPRCKINEGEATHHIFESESSSEGVPIDVELFSETWKVTLKKRTDTRNPLHCDDLPASVVQRLTLEEDESDDSQGTPAPTTISTVHLPQGTPAPTPISTVHRPGTPSQTPSLVGTPSPSENSLFAVVKAKINDAVRTPTVLRFRLKDDQSLCSVDLPPCLTVCLSPGLKVSKVELRTNAKDLSLVLPTKKILVDGARPASDCDSICACDLYAALKNQPNAQWCQSNSFELVVTPTEFVSGTAIGFVTSVGTLSEPYGAVQQAVTAAVIPSSLLRCTMKPELRMSMDVRYVIAGQIKKGMPPVCQTAKPDPQSGMFYEVWSTTHSDWLLSRWFKTDKLTEMTFSGFYTPYMCYSEDWKWQAHSVVQATDESRSVVKFDFPNTAEGLSSWNPCSIKEPVCMGICYPPDVKPTKVALVVPGAKSPVTLKTSVAPNGSVLDGKMCSIACACAIFEALAPLNPKSICKPVNASKEGVSLVVALDRGTLSQLEAMVVSGGSKTLMGGSSRITGSTTLTSFLQDVGEKVCVSKRTDLTPNYIRKTSTVSLQSATAVPVCQKGAPVKDAQKKDYWVVWSRAPKSGIPEDMVSHKIMMPFVSRSESLLLHCEESTSMGPKIRGKPLGGATTADRDRSLVASFFRYQSNPPGVMPRKINEYKTAFDIKLDPKEASALCSPKTPFVLSVFIPVVETPKVYLVLNKKAPIQLRTRDFSQQQGWKDFTVEACPVWEVFRAAGSCVVTTVEIHVEHSGVAPDRLLYVFSGSQIPSTIKPGNNVTVSLDDGDVAVWAPPSVECRSSVEVAEAFRIASSQETNIPICLAEGYGPSSDDQHMGTAYVITGKTANSHRSATGAILPSTFSCGTPSSASPAFSNYTIAISTILGFCAAFSPLHRKHDNAEY